MTKPTQPLENLPAELRYQLLCILILQELHNLINASAVFYWQYRSHRRNLLLKCLDQELCSAAVDAYMVQQSSLPEFKKARSGAIVVSFIKGYKDRLSRPYSLLNENISEAQAINMAAFHLSIIQPVMDEFISWAWKNLAKETVRIYQNQPLSKTEEIRILRGFYRYQLCCNLFGTIFEWDPLDTRYCLYRGFGEMMYLLFEAWEIEEIHCISTFVNNQYDSMNIEIDQHVRGNQNQCCSDARKRHNAIWRSLYLLGTTCQGLETLHDIKFRDRPLMQCLPIIESKLSMIGGPGEPFDDSAGFSTRSDQDRFRRDYELEGNLKMQRRSPLRFQGDNEPRLGERKDPPLAWTIMWNGTYSNLHGEYIPKNMRLWAYIMWDAARLEHTGGKDVLTRQFRAEIARDPRIGLEYYNGNINQLHYF